MIYIYLEMVLRVKANLYASVHLSTYISIL